jgi:hypothetical protein
MTTFSTEVTNHRSVTNTKNPTTATEGTLKCSSATVSVAAADNDGKILHMLPVHSSWSIKSIQIYNDAITGGTSYDLGVYTNAATPVVVDVDAYGTAIDMSSARAATGPLHALAEVRDIININNKVHQDAGVTVDPAAWYLLSFTANTVGSAQGDITVVIYYVE